MEDALYYPILRAKAGEIEALGHLSPTTRSRIRPLLDLPKWRSDDKKPLQAHCLDTVTSVAANWGRRYPLFLDMSAHEPDIVVAGTTVVEYIFDLARQLKLKAMPVTGPEIDRGPGPAYLEAVGRIARRDGFGAGLRLSHSDLLSTRVISVRLKETLQILGLQPSEVDLYLDLGAIDVIAPSGDLETPMLSDLTRAITEAAAWRFRSIILCASNIPQNVGRKRSDQKVIIPRLEIELWNALQRGSPDSWPRYGDYGVVYPMEGEPSGPVRVPARIRLGGRDAYYLWRSQRGNYRALARTVLADETFRQVSPSWGRTAIVEAALGSGDVGGPANWVGRDTNCHLETTAQMMWDILVGSGRLQELALAEPEREPWLQQILLPP